MTTRQAARVAALENHEAERIMALPPRQWITEGYLTFPHLSPEEWSELEALLETAFTDRGYLDYTRLTPAQRSRAVDLVRMGSGCEI